MLYIFQSFLQFYVSFLNITLSYNLLSLHDCIFSVPLQQSIFCNIQSIEKNDKLCNSVRRFPLWAGDRVCGSSPYIIIVLTLQPVIFSYPYLIFIDALVSTSKAFLTTLASFIQSHMVEHNICSTFFYDILTNKANIV